MLIFITGLLVAFMLLGGVVIRLAENELTRSQRQTTTELAARATAVHWATYGDPAAARLHGLGLVAAHEPIDSPEQDLAAEVQFGRTLGPETAGDWQFQPARTPFNSVRVTLPSPPGVSPLASLAGQPARGTKRRPPIATTVTFRDRDIVCLIDNSLFQTATRRGALRQACGTLFASLRRAPGVTWVGLVVAGDPPRTAVPLAAASEQQAARFDAATVVPASPPTASLGSGLDGGLDAACRLLQAGRPAGHVDRMVIVLTDRSSSLAVHSPAMAELLASRGVILHTVLWSSAALDASPAKLAEGSGGRAFQAADGAELAGIFRQLALTVRTIRIE